MRKIIIYTIAAALFATPAAGGALFEDGPGWDEPFDPSAVSIAPPEGMAHGGYAAGLISSAGSGGFEISAAGAERSPALEGAASFLLPGLGQWRMGRTTRAKIFFGLEGLAWVAVGSFLWQSHERREAYEEYAVAFASVNGTGHSDDYYEHVGNYRSSDGPGGYNESVLIEARDLYYPDRNAIDEYYAANRVPPSMYWLWESDGAFKRYNSLRAGQTDARSRALYAVFFAIGLRVVSTVDAVRLARSAGERQEVRPSGISIGLDPAPGGFLLSLNHPF